MTSAETEMEWAARLHRIIRMLPPSRFANAEQYLGVIRDIDTTPEGSRPIIITAELPIETVSRIGEAIGAETQRRRWLHAFAECVTAVVEAAADEAQRRYDRNETAELAFAGGARFVADAVATLLNTENPTVPEPVTTYNNAPGALNVD